MKFVLKIYLKLPDTMVSTASNKNSKLNLIYKACNISFLKGVTVLEMSLLPNNVNKEIIRIPFVNILIRRSIYSWGNIETNF